MTTMTTNRSAHHPLTRRRKSGAIAATLTMIDSSALAATAAIAFILAVKLSMIWALQAA